MVDCWLKIVADIGMHSQAYGHDWGGRKEVRGKEKELSSRGCGRRRLASLLGGAALAEFEGGEKGKHWRRGGNDASL